MKHANDTFFKKMLEENSEFRRIYEAHREYEKRVAKLSKKTYLTKEEENEKKMLQKMKLAHKDKMETMASTYTETRG